MTHLSRYLLFICAFIVAGCSNSPSPTAPNRTADGTGKKTAPKQHVFVVSIDGLMPQSYMDPDSLGLKVPTLRELRRNGAYSPGATTVFPSITYPSHTSMVTGMRPTTHGIHSNAAWDPERRNQEGWWWYVEDIKVPTIFHIAQAAGRRTALLHWPVTVGADVDVLVPDYERARTLDDIKLIKALSTPGLFDGVQARFPDFFERYTPWKVSDRSAMDIAVHLIETEPPELMFIHTLKVDDYTHKYGPWHDQVKSKVEQADAALGRLIDAAKKAGIWDKTTLVVVSDHGFIPIHTRFRPGHVLKKIGLIPADQSENLSFWKANVVSSGGGAYIYVRDENDEATKRLLIDTFTAMVGKPDSGVKRVYSRDDILAKGGDPRALIALEAVDGFRFSMGYDGEMYTPKPNTGHHGYDPDRPEMKTTFLMYGPGIKPGKVDDVRLIDLAPTIASWLALSMPGTEGRVLDVRR